jgi:hypothetical protein
VAQVAEQLLSKSKALGVQIQVLKKKKEKYYLLIKKKERKLVSQEDLKVHQLIHEANGERSTNQEMSGKKPSHCKQNIELAADFNDQSV